MAMCEEFGLATGVQNQYDDTKDWIFDSRLVFVSRRRHLEGERNYGQQTLATAHFWDRIFAVELYMWF